MPPLGLEYWWRVIFNGLGSKLINQVSKFSNLRQTFNEFYISSENTRELMRLKQSLINLSFRFLIVLDRDPTILL